MVKIFMCTHKSVELCPPLCVPVQGGASLSPPIENAISDNGKKGSISHKNPQYCELTVQYYAWKNEDLDYYGFCHYRRFFCFDRSITSPYLVFDKIPQKKMKLLGSEEEIKKIVKEYDVIVPRGEDVGVSAYEKYASSPHHFKEDIDLFVSLINEMYPHLTPYAKEYLQGRVQYFCNMFIMKREIFFEYSEILFSLLEELDKRKAPHGYFQGDRTNGYLGERLLGIYLLYLKDKGKKIGELSRIDTMCPLKKRIANKLFPPQSRRRLFIKAIGKRGIKK